jgi:large subunit ribosomal protein L15
MLKLSELKIAKGSTHSRKIVGRGIGSGIGKTCTRGTKGAGARSGAQTHPGFEGGQTPLFRRIPKKGFHNINKVSYAVINLGQIAGLGLQDGSEVDAALYVKDLKNGVKILSDGDYNLKLTIIADAFSKSAKEKIEKAGGTAKVR